MFRIDLKGLLFRIEQKGLFYLTKICHRSKSFSLQIEIEILGIKFPFLFQVDSLEDKSFLLSEYLNASWKSIEVRKFLSKSHKKKKKTCHH